MSKDDKGDLSRAGSAALFGFLYQLTASAHQVVHAQVEDDTKAAGAMTITAVLEPVAGGDLVVDHGNRKKAIQYKYRSSPLPAADLVGSVLPDLFRAHCAGPLDAYELQCSNAISAAAIAALEAVRAAGAIMGSKANRFARQARDTCLEIWKASHGGDDDGFAYAYVMFLERFRIADRLLPSRIWEELRAWILPKVTYQGDAEAVLTQMLGELVRLCRNNDQVISVASLLRAVGLERMAQLTPAEQRVRLKGTAIAALDGVGFDPALDVRDELRVSEIDALTLIRGGSGCGKSWALYRLASGMIERDTPVVLVRAKSLRELKERIKAVVVAGALGEDRPYDLPSIGGVWRRFQSRPGDLIWVLWEGCGSLDDLEEVARAGGLGEGLALVAEVPPYVGADQADALSAASFPVGLFSQVELVQALARRGLNAAEIPGEIQKMLFLPVLCDIYAQTARDTPGWAPQNEYLVLEEFWRRARKKGGLGTEGRLKALAAALMDGNVTSVDDAVTEACGFTEARLEVLQAAGWLATDGQAWGFAHDRLMTWACAKALVDMVKSGDVSAETLCDKIDILAARPSDRGALGGLAFLMMDVIWLLAGAAGQTDPMEKLIRSFEVKDGRLQEEFYSHLLPTCGSRVLPAIERRLEALDGSEDIHFQISVVDGLIVLDPPPADRDRIVAGLWNHPASTSRDIVLRLGRTWPLTVVRHDVWRAYVQISPATMEPDDAGRDMARFAKVIRRLATDDPSWVVALFEATSDDTELYGVSHFLSDLDATVGRPIWLAVKVRLVAEIPAVNGAVLANCAEHFLDRDFVDQLVDLCRDDGWSGWKAFCAICALAPETALSVIETSPPNRQFIGGGDWFDHLLDFDAPHATAAVERWLFEIDPTGRTFADVWWHYARRAPEAVISRLADMFQAQLSRQGKIERTDRILLAVLGNTELSEAGEAWLGQSADPAFGNAVLDETRLIEAEENPWRIADLDRLMARLGGDAFQQFILRKLLDSDETTQRKGIELSYQCQTDEILLALKSLLPLGKQNLTKPNLWTETWRAIRPMDPDFWWSSMKAFLVGDDDDDRMLALTLLDDEDTSALESELQSALEKSAPDTRVEASALDVIRNDHVQNPVALSRVQAREAAGLPLRTADLNILLNSTADTAVTIVHRHLTRMITATSWSSTDFRALDIYLRSGNADDALWEFAERHLSTPSFARGDLVDAFMETRSERVLPHLLERVYSQPGIFTDVQPDALKHLASRWPELAADAFDLCWRRSPDRRSTLTHLIRLVGQTAVRTVISDVARDPEAYSEDKKLVRRVGYQLRNLAELAHHAIDEAYAEASDSARTVLCSLTAWLPDSEGRLEELATGEGSGRVRSHALRLIWKHRARADAIRAFREKPTVKGLLKTIELIDPVILFRKADPWNISSIILSDIRLLLFAEANVGRRFHEINGERNRRLRFGRHLLPPGG